MDIDWNAEIVDQLESHWQHQLRPRLDGLTDDEYVWQPAGEPVPTIAWRVGHLIDNFGPPGVPHFADPPAAYPPVRYPGTAKEALQQLDEGYGAWISDVRGLGAAGLARPQGGMSPPQFADAPLVRKIFYTHVEIIHHGAEVCLLRDLYQARF